MSLKVRESLLTFKLHSTKLLSFLRDFYNYSNVLFMKIFHSKIAILTIKDCSYHLTEILVIFKIYLPL